MREVILGRVHTKTNPVTAKTNVQGVKVCSLWKYELHTKFCYLKMTKRNSGKDIQIGDNNITCVVLVAAFKAIGQVGFVISSFNLNHHLGTNVLL